MSIAGFATAAALIALSAVLAAHERTGLAVALLCLSIAASTVTAAIA